MPRGNSVEKNAAMRALGVTLIEHGKDFQEAREHAMDLARERSAHMVRVQCSTLIGTFSQRPRGQLLGAGAQA